MTDAGTGPYEATVEPIDGSWAQLRVHAVATDRRATAWSVASSSAVIGHAAALWAAGAR